MQGVREKGGSGRISNDMRIPFVKGFISESGLCREGPKAMRRTNHLKNCARIGEPTEDVGEPPDAVGGKHLPRKPELLLLNVDT